MERIVDIVLAPVEAADPVLVRQAAEAAASMKRGTAAGSRILKRSIDARSKQPRIRLRVAVSDAKERYDSSARFALGGPTTVGVEG